MSIKSRIKKLEQSVTGAKKTPYEEWQEREKKNEEIETLYEPIMNAI